MRRDMRKDAVPVPMGLGQNDLLPIQGSMVSADG
jgi:hypothetical protein